MTIHWRDQALQTWRQAIDEVPGSLESARLSVDALRILALGVAESGSLDDVSGVELMADRTVAAVTLAVAWRALAGDGDFPPPPSPGARTGEASILREARAVVEGTGDDACAS